MSEWAMLHQTEIRVGVFVSGLLVFGLLEAVLPRRTPMYSRLTRWPVNLGVTVLGAIAVRLLVPSAAIGTAILTAERDWGVLRVVPLPPWLALALAVVALDLLVYLQHILFHAVPLLWRLHMVHHADLDFDVTTGTRFHPIEIVLSMFLKMAAVAALGAPVLSVLAFEVVLNLTALFNHSNLRIPKGVDYVLRLLLVTPDMHRVHHSVYPSEANTNFGFNLSWWDLVFGTYRDQPAAGHEGMSIGLRRYRERSLGPIGILTFPFVGEPGNYPLSRPRRRTT